MTPRTKYGYIAHYEEGPCVKPPGYEHETHERAGRIHYRTWFEPSGDGVDIRRCPACEMFARFMAAER
jgi:hypothetical protein